MITNFPAKLLHHCGQLSYSDWASLCKNTIHLLLFWIASLNIFEVSQNSKTSTVSQKTMLIISRSKGTYLTFLAFWNYVHYLCIDCYFDLKYIHDRHPGLISTDSVSKQFTLHFHNAKARPFHIKSSNLNKFVAWPFIFLLTCSSVQRYNKTRYKLCLFVYHCGCFNHLWHSISSKSARMETHISLKLKEIKI